MQTRILNSYVGNILMLLMKSILDGIITKKTVNNTSQLIQLNYKQDSYK